MDKRESLNIATSTEIKPTTSQTDLAKKIQNRLRLRKKSSNKTEKLIGKEEFLKESQTDLDLKIEPLE